MFKRTFFPFLQQPVMWVLLLLNCALFGLVSSKSPSISAQTLREFGAQFNPGIWSGESYRLLFAGFLHGSLTHLLMNNLSLYFLGKLLEQLMGSTAFLALYLLSLLSGSVASLYFMPPMAVSVGASGAIMGLAGSLFSMLLLDRHGRFLSARPFGRYLFFALVLFYLVIGKIFPVVNGAAHIGGFAMGCIFGVFFWSRIPGEKVPRPVGSVLLFFAIFTLGTATLYGLKPKGTYAWDLHLGLEGYQKGNNADAIQNLTSAIQKNPDSPYAYRYLAQLYFYTKRYRKASDLYGKLLARQPSQAGYWYYYITALHRSQQHKKAEEEYKRAAAQLQRRGKKRGWFRNARQHEQQQLWQWAHLMAAHRKEKQALLYYQQLLQLYPDNPSLHNEVAWLLLTAHNPKYRNPGMALKHAQLATSKLERPSAGYLDTLAAALFQNGRVLEAVKQARGATRSPGAKEIMPHLQEQLKRFEATLKQQRLQKKKQGRVAPNSQAQPQPSGKTGAPGSKARRIAPSAPKQPQPSKKNPPPKRP